MFANEDGAALIVTLGVIMIMMATGVVVVSMTVNRDKTVTHDRQLSEAESVAEAGADEAINVTLGNYASVYQSGIPSADTPGDGALLFNNIPLKSSDGTTVVGHYSVWTKADPERTGNVLITAKGTDDAPAASAFSSTVRVSVKYVSTFDYTLFTGAPSHLSTTTLTAQGRGDHEDEDEDCGEDDDHGDDGSCGANISVTGKVNVNGTLAINALESGNYGSHYDDHDGHHHYDDHNHHPGYVTFLPRDGFADPVNWTSALSGNRPSGTQPERGNTVAFPTVVFSAFTGSSVTTVNFTSSGTPSGWSRNYHNNTYSISADNFQSRYGSYDVVKLTTNLSNVKLQVTGSCSSPSITSTIMIPGVSGSAGISELDLVGPGIDLQPNNGIAILAGEGLVSLQNEVEVGALNDGALIYVNGQNGATSTFQATGNLIMYGSLVVNGTVNMTAQGVGRVDHHEHDNEDHHYGSYYCDANYDEHHHEHDDEHHDNNENHTINQFITYDGAYLTNSRLPKETWWTWTGGSDYTAVKDNFVRS